MATKTKIKVKRRPSLYTAGERDDYVITGVKSPWWTILGLTSDERWVELFQARDKAEGKRYLAGVLDSTDPQLQKYEDFALQEPLIEHSINSNLKGQHRAYVASNSPITKEARRKLSQSTPTRAPSRKRNQPATVEQPVVKRGSAKSRATVRKAK